MSICHSFRKNDNNIDNPVEPQAQEDANADVNEVQPNDEAGPPPAKKRRFDLGTDENEAGYELPESNVDYVHKYMSTHISE